MAGRCSWLRIWTALLIATALLLLCLLGSLPPWTRIGLILRIAVSEGGSWLALVGAAVIALAAIPGPRPRMRWAAIAAATLAMIIALLPLLRVAGNVRQADAALVGALGADWIARIPSEARAGMRHAPFRLRDLALGIPSGAVDESLLVGDGGFPPMLLLRSREVAGPLPIVVALHGGGWQGGSVAEGAACHRYLATRGYLVYSIDYARAPARRFPVQLDEVNAALTWIASRAPGDGGDPARIVLLGRSAGAQLALLAAYGERQPAIAAVVSFYGPIDLLGGYRDPPRPDPLDVRLLISDYLGGTPDQQPQAYRAASPLSFADRPRPPTLLITGSDDHAVLLSFQRRMRDRLTAGGTPVALIELAGAEHAFDRVPGGPGGQVSLYYLERFIAWAVAR
ncbi:MAG: alpha/beta hydrolase [Planctomycetes bacterium]|nr:alpha/beta hydrolase [Planctomycetota bacterium]